MASASTQGTAYARVDGVYESLPAVLCLNLEDEVTRALAAGAGRLRIDLRHDRAWPLYRSFSLYWVDRVAGRRELVQQFATHPDIVSTDDGVPQPQSFGIDLAPLQAWPLRQRCLCLELDGEPVAATGVPLPGRLHVVLSFEPF